MSVNPILGMKEPWRYRNKAQLHAAQIKGKLKLGYYQTGSRQLISFDDCLLLSPEVNSLIKKLEEELNRQNVIAYNSKTKTGSLKHVVVKQSQATKEMMIIFITVSAHFPQGKAIAAKVMAENNQVKSVMHNINPNPKEILGRDFKLLAGVERIKEKLGDLEFLISPSAFFQVNTRQATVLAEKMLEYANLDGSETAFDLYCGTGTLSLWLAKKAKEVYGIEANSSAIEDAKANAEFNNIANTEFIAETVEKALPELIVKNIKPDLILLDPPRQGATLPVLKAIANATPKQLIYISCDPGTLSRDLSTLKDLGYQTLEIQPVDMFGWTSHIECVIGMQRKDT